MLWVGHMPGESSVCAEVGCVPVKDSVCAGGMAPTNPILYLLWVHSIHWPTALSELEAVCAQSVLGVGHFPVMGSVCYR